jgi:hypothetical protein
MEDLIANQLVKYLEARGVEHVFGLCGHTNIAVLAALGKSQKIKFVNTRHEQIAAHAADGYARATRKASVLLTHLSPGLTNAATGVANASLDSIPMVVIAGDVPTHYFGKNPHQEVNLHADASQLEIYRPFVKRAWRVDSAHLFPEILEKAFILAESGRPGPVLIDVPMDIFSKKIDTALFERMLANQRQVAKPSLDEATAERMVKTLLEARTPLLYVGGGIMLADAMTELREFAEHLSLPVAHTLMEGRPCGRPPADPRHDRLLGHQVHQRQVQRGRLDPGARDPLLRGRLQLLGTRIHLQLPADPADADRYRSLRDRQELSRRLRRRRRPEVRAWDPAAGRAQDRSERGQAAGAVGRDGRQPRGLRRRQAGEHGKCRLADEPRAHPGRPAPGAAPQLHHLYGRGLEQERARPAVPGL